MLPCKQHYWLPETERRLRKEDWEQHNLVSFWNTCCKTFDEGKNDEKGEYLNFGHSFTYDSFYPCVKEAETGELLLFQPVSAAHCSPRNTVPTSNYFLILQNFQIASIQDLLTDVAVFDSRPEQWVTEGNDNQCSSPCSRVARTSWCYF